MLLLYHRPSRLEKLRKTAAGKPLGWVRSAFHLVEGAPARSCPRQNRLSSMMTSAGQDWWRRAQSRERTAVGNKN